MHILRINNCGGGVGLLYNKCYKIEKQDVTSFLSFEYMEVLLRTPATILRIGVLYRPPPSTQNGLTATMFFNEFPILLERLAVASGHLLLTGDVNFHVDDCTDSLTSRLLDLLDSHNLIQHVSGPTHKDNHTLDLMITRACEDIIESWSTLNPHLTDHSGIHSKLSLARPHPPKVEFRNDVMASTLFSSPACNANDLCDKCDSELSKVVDVHAPLKTRFVTSRPSAPWYSEEIAAEKRKRRKLERRWRKSGTEADKLQYSDQCSRVRKLLKSSKMSYYASLINENKSDSKVLFNTIDRMLHRKPQNHYPSCGSPKELCDKFTDFFCDKILTIRHQLDTLSITDAPVFPLIDEAIITCELSEFSPTSEDELSGLGKKNRRQIVFS